jgi:3-phenylpropionate/cinnamic acid dioxygenase small subunit
MTTHEVAVEIDLSVRRILARYSHLVDDRDFDAAAALFTDDARFRVGEQTLSGRAEILSWLQSVPAGLSHQVTNVVVSNGSHEGTFHALADVAIAQKGEGAWSTFMLGRYHDTLVGTGRSMVFSQRIITFR